MHFSSSQALLLLQLLFVTAALSMTSGMFHADTHKQIDLTSNSKISLNIKDKLATITVYQTFSNKGDAPVSAYYKFPHQLEVQLVACDIFASSTGAGQALLVSLKRDQLLTATTATITNTDTFQLAPHSYAIVKVTYESKTPPQLADNEDDAVSQEKFTIPNVILRMGSTSTAAAAHLVSNNSSSNISSSSSEITYDGQQKDSSSTSSTVIDFEPVQLTMTQRYEIKSVRANLLGVVTQTRSESADDGKTPGTAAAPFVHPDLRHASIAGFTLKLPNSGQLANKSFTLQVTLYDHTIGGPNTLFKAGTVPPIQPDLSKEQAMFFGVERQLAMQLLDQLQSNILVGLWLPTTDLVTLLNLNDNVVLNPPEPQCIAKDSSIWASMLAREFLRQFQIQQIATGEYSIKNGEEKYSNIDMTVLKRVDRELQGKLGARYETCRTKARTTVKYFGKDLQ